MQTSVQNNRNPHLVRALGPLILVFLFLTGIVAQTTHAQPAPRPETLPVFFDPDHVYNEAQTSTLARDAQLLQSSKIPTVVYVRIATPDEAGSDKAGEFARDIRLDWQVETKDGADDGLVLLYSHVPDNPAASSVVASWGNSTFAHSGLGPAYIESVLSGDVRALLDQGHPFEALVYGIRELRYAGIYFPPTPAPLTGARKVLHNAINLAGPALVAIVTAICVFISWNARHARAVPSRRRWQLVSVAGIVVVLLSALSVIGQSRIGIASAALILVVLAIQVSVWTHPVPRNTSWRRVRHVSPTSRLMRKRAQARRINAAGRSGT